MFLFFYFVFPSISLFAHHCLLFTAPRRVIDANANVSGQIWACSVAAAMAIYYNITNVKMCYTYV